MKKLKVLCTAAAVAAAFGMSTVNAAAFKISYDLVTEQYTGSVYRLVINDKEMTNLPMEPIIFNDRALVPVREIFEELGATVNYNGTTRGIDIDYNKTSIYMKINDNVTIINGKRTKIPDGVVPKLITKVGGETKTMVPLRFISETIGMKVIFEGETGTIYVNSPDYKAPTPEPTVEPTIAPTPEPTVAPTIKPTAKPTEKPTSTKKPSATAKPSTSSKPSTTAKPSASATPEPTKRPLSALKGAGTTAGVTGADVNTEFVMQGVDVSHWQNDIDWKTAKDEIDFAILSIGYGQDETEQDDRKFKRNADACVKYGIPFGVYIYSYATTVEGARGEADHVLRMIDGYKLQFPVYYDLEEEAQRKLESEELGAMAQAFCDRIEDAGYEVGIYANTYWWTEVLTDEAFKNPKWYKWVAQYNTENTYKGKYTMWQYSSQGEVEGMDGDIDMNYWYGDKRRVTSK